MAVTPAAPVPVAKSECDVAASAPTEMTGINMLLALAQTDKAPPAETSGAAQEAAPTPVAPVATVVEEPVLAQTPAVKEETAVEAPMSAAKTLTSPSIGMVTPQAQFAHRVPMLETANHVERPATESAGV